MNVAEYMGKHGLTDEMLDDMAAPYEDGIFKEERGAVHVGSHVEAVGESGACQGTAYRKMESGSSVLMPWVVLNAVPREDYTLELEFKDGKKGVYDARPLLDSQLFAPLGEISCFMTARTAHDTVAWDGGIDIAPEHLYEECVSV